MNPTGTEARVCADIADRQAKGTAKYGTTAQDNPLGLIQWLQHAYEERLDQAVYLKRAIEQLTGVDEGIRIKAAIRTLEEIGHSWSGGVLWRPPIGPRPAWLDKPQDQIPSDPAELDLGQGDVHIRKVADELKDPHAEPAPPTDPHAALKAIYRPGMRWRGRNRSLGVWSEWIAEKISNPGWYEECDYEIHPDDLPKEPTEDGWITVPDDCMEMPEGLSREVERVMIRNRKGKQYSTSADLVTWDRESSDPLRVMAYRLIKPAE